MAATPSVTLAAGNEADVRRNRSGGPAVPSEQKSRLLLAETKSMSGKIASGQSLTTQPAKVTPFAGGNEADVRRNRFLRFRPI
ncbi:MAG TPA: hypothetical protein VEQ14_04520 [Steroidobacteraceae bacterium]|nr:hypothetical protein [Steroidobacteraceae bacterium]